MNIKQFVAELSQQGVKLWVEDEQLRANAPKGVLTAETRDLLVKNKAELILWLHQKNELAYPNGEASYTQRPVGAASRREGKLTGGIATDTDLPLIKGDRTQNLPLSFGQEQIWLLNQLEPNNPFYNEQAALRLRGNLNVVALEQSLNKIIARHESLRTNFRTFNEQPIQVIAESLTLNLSVVDLTELPKSEREIACQQLATAEAIRPFDLANSGLIRASVLQLTELEHVLLLTLHHIVFDAWSVGVLMRELATIYSGLCNNLSPELPELQIQYADFAIWQRQWLQTEVLQRQLNYWQQLLKNAPSLLELPTDRPRPAIQTFRGARQHIKLSIELSEALANFSKQEKATLFTTLFTAFVTLLYRYTGSDDILVGTPIANRDRFETEDLIGFFVNTLVLRTDLSGNPSFKQLLSRVRQLMSQAYAHSDLPFEELVKALQPERDLSHTPLFQVMFLLQNASVSQVDLTGLTVSPLVTERTTAKFDLTLFMENTTTGLVSTWEYNTDLFDASTIERMAGHFVTLLSGIVANPKEQISQLPLLTKPEQRQLLVEWNDTQAEYPLDKCIHQLFEEQVERTPDAIAVVFENQQLTYQQLNCRANQLAHYLQSLGVKADVLVGLCVERSLEMVVALLGILKAGGAYLPLDPEYPTERLSFMLEDAQVSVLLTQQPLLERLPEHQAHLACLDTDWQAISLSSQNNTITDVQANNLAYIIYTSGSTGKPKGVALNQLALCNLILWQLQNNTISTEARTLQFAPISFDVSFQEIFTTWFSGGTLFLIGEELRRDPVALLGFLKEKAVERLFVPFVVLQQLAEVAIDSELVNSHLREIITAGEQLQITPAISQWLGKLSDCTLHNHYGPSESHVVTTFRLPDPVENWPLLPPIGKPIANTQIYILDKYLQPVPIGVPGELYIGGVSLARGYLNRPELTQDKFILNPFDETGESRLYKTGDLVRYFTDGNIEYLSRIDNQVKIRGFRIELGEIEAALSQYSDVQAACVIPREDTPGDTCTERSRSKRLVAYVVPHQHCLLSISELRQFLKAKLPEYMVPNGFVILESLPLTPSGKVDRRVLPAPDLHSELKDKYIAPRTPIEEMLAQIWAQVLKVKQVGIHDNFFEVGGHSLLATQLVSRIRNIFKVELPLRELFVAATVAELAHFIGQLQQQNFELTSTPILPRAKNAELPLSYAQQRLWFLDQLEPNSAIYNISLALRLVGTLNQTVLEQSLHEIIARHEALHTNFVIVDGQPTQIIHTETAWRMSVIDCEGLSTTEQEIASQQLAITQAIQPFDLASEALVRATLIVLSETEHVLSICMHHVVSDAWSMGVFVQELAALYNAYSQDQPSGASASRSLLSERGTPLAPLPIQYADFAIWQRQWLQGDVLERQLVYWQQQLKDAPALLSLPTDRPRPAVQSFAGAYQKFALSRELTSGLIQLSQKQGVTLFMTLLAAFDTLLYRYTGSDDILVGSPIANRDRSEIEGLIGFFVNTLVMRTNLSGNPSFSELLNRVREMAMDAYSHQNLPFEMLVEALQPQRDLSHTPLFQMMFALQNAPISEVELTGLTISSLPAAGTTSKFDLSLLMENTATSTTLSTGTGLVGVWEYSTNLFDASTIERMTGHFVTLLEGIVANPQQKISQLPLLTEVEQQQLLVEWNDTQADYLQHKCIHQLFEEQVERIPDAVAVVFGNQQLTYCELNSRANQLAHYLKSLGVGADVLVGLYVERSLETIVGILGILKAGGAYVPLDPDYPQERLAYMLNDSQVSVLLTQEKLLTSLPEHGAHVLCLDKDWEDISTENKDNLVSGLTTDNLAYVIYTSGSTGQPKGTLVSHSNVVRLFEATDSWYNFNQDDVWTMFHSYAFDFSVWEIWGALLYGGRLVVVPYLVTRSPESFFELLAQEKVTILNQTPSAFRQLIQAEQSIAITGNLNLRLVIFGGEALELLSLQPWFERHGDKSPQLVNMYGITETTVHVTYRPLSKTDLNGTASVIGRPIPDLQVYVLDEYLQPMPIGVAGEMYVGGAGVARGYLNRPELTAQRFISNPFSNNPKARLYKSGDLARYLPNGELEYLGRIDQQVKIRGFRIELGEIEALLAQHPAIWESAVLVREDEPGNKRLVAYVVPKTEQSPTAAELRRFLKQKLPEYMVPSAFVQLEVLPLTANGKVDRRALPVPDTARPELENVFVAPSTPEEKILAAIWTKVLDVEQVGINDNFFALGGDSIRSIQVLSQAKEQGLSLSVQQLFQYQTIHELVQELKTQENDITKLELTQPFSLISQADKQQLPDGLEDAYPLAMLQMGMIYHSEYSQDSAVYHDIFSFHLKTPFDVQLLQVAIQDLVNHHAVLRTSFELSNFSIPLQLVHQQVEVPLQVEDWCDLNHSEQEEALAAWFAAEKKRHFNWTHPPLVRFFVHRRTQETFNLALSFHHAILDGWSVASMMSELLKRYLSLLGEPVDYVSPQFSIAFRDFVALEQQAIASSSTGRYWSERLNDSTFTKLPRWSFVQTNTNVREVGVQEVTLSSEIFAGLKQLAQSAEVTLKSVLLAAHLRVLNFLTGESDVVTGIAANGRPEQSDGERVLGLFLNTLPFRLQFAGGTWTDLVQQVFAAEREMLPHRRYPLAEIQRSLGSESPLFETAFNFTHFHVYEQVLGLDNLQLLGGKFFEQTNFTFLAQFSVSPNSSEVALNLKYDPYELCSEQINRISDYYLRVLAAMANQPQGRYELHSLVSLEERHQLLVEWNQTAVEYPKDKCIHQLFEAQVEQTPNATAVIFGDQHLTYTELNARANQLAHYLQTLGIKPEVLVGLCVERSLEMIVGMLGILKAGGAYVPLDPEYPQERLSFMLEDTQLSVVLTQEKLVNKLGSSLRRGCAEPRSGVICLDSNWDIISQQAQHNPTTSVTSDNLAYVMYTSGSTGQPKGVSIVHRGVVRLVKQTNYVSISAQDVIAQASNYAFDAATFEIWGALLNGAQLVGVSKDLALSPQDFAAFIRAQSISVLFLTTALFNQIAQEAPSAFNTVRHLLFGGEAVDPKWVKEVLKNGAPQQLLHVYGPTENTTFTSWYLVQDVPEDATTIPIGQPISNTQIYVLDSQLQPVGVGLPGEVYIGGDGLAREYLNRPELTQQKFILNPFSSDDHSRLYKTGDKARYLPDGNIEYLGRIDNQVKIRGFRIELGEIEAILSQHGDVQASCVIPREETPGDTCTERSRSKRLVAYLVPYQDCTLRISKLRQYLKAKLPDYMVPNAFVILESLPLTPNGKVDRRALPVPDLYIDLADKYVAPRNQIEETLAQMWLQVLGLEQVGIHDNFFELGGHSLLATQLVSRIRDRFKVQLSLSELFNGATIAELAQSIGKLQQQNLDLTVPRILPRSKR
ncbi:MAG: amino acid adenylation domain-containing protein [Nostoc sp. DedQUE12b]|uniref:non-ribosomal peptide synthetase n=1 Tax=Nostoc sp. DedQUE12b TaxID=3075398 RepID=UPI002AD2822F|nr:non-ribosomal peptide synthetase [Nostoc sp. DedQUE12b]MDZ8084002.1 amino acid adenylation domain-containing protein [Nostoc sp. DedQUE12b]